MLIGRGKAGRHGKDKKVLVPLGTVVTEVIKMKDEWDEVVSERLGESIDMDEHGKTILLAKGTF